MQGNRTPNEQPMPVAPDLVFYQNFTKNSPSLWGFFFGTQCGFHPVSNPRSVFYCMVR
jgi:hypothetical protein